jgi:hypothetical protein
MSSALPTRSEKKQGIYSPFKLSPEEMKESVPAMLGVLNEYFNGQALYTVARLGCADIIGSRTMSAAEIVNEIDASNADKSLVRKEALHRCLRFLTVRGFFKVLFLLHHHVIL